MGIVPGTPWLVAPADKNAEISCQDGIQTMEEWGDCRIAYKMPSSSNFKGMRFEEVYDTFPTYSKTLLQKANTEDHRAFREYMRARIRQESRSKGQSGGVTPAEESKGLSGGVTPAEESSASPRRWRMMKVQRQAA